MNLVWTPKKATDLSKFCDFVDESIYYADLINASFYFSIPNKNEAEIILKDIKSKGDMNGSWYIEE